MAISGLCFGSTAAAQGRVCGLLTCAGGMGKVINAQLLALVGASIQSERQRKILDNCPECL